MVLIMKTVKFRAAWFRPYSRVIWSEIYIEPNAGKYPQNRRVCEYKKVTHAQKKKPQLECIFVRGFLGYQVIVPNVMELQFYIN